MKLIIPDPDGMSDDVFCKHMTKRHRDSLGGLRFLWQTSPGTMEAWRMFHDRLHHLRVDLVHEHRVD